MDRFWREHRLMPPRRRTTPSNPSKPASAATEAKLATHEAVCAERYAGLLSRLGRLETVLLGANGVVITLLLAALAAFVSHKLW